MHFQINAKAATEDFCTIADLARAKFFETDVHFRARKNFLKKFSCELRNAMSTRFDNPAFPPFDSAFVLAKNQKI
jgi:hypothetical protein